MSDALRVEVFDERPALGLPECRFFLASALACGFALESKFPVRDFFDAEGDDLDAFNARLQNDPQSVRRKVTVTFDAAVKAAFCSPAGFEMLTIQEFRQRWDDEAWRKANPEHPISYQWAMMNWLKQAAVSLKDRQSIRLRKGDREAFIMVNASGDPKVAADNAQILEWFRNGLPAKGS